VVTKPTLLLGPGASGGVERLAPLIKRLGALGVVARAVPLPRGTAERAIPVYRAAIDAADDGPLVIGGHSFGGRVASMLAAEGAAVQGLVLLSYPLHAPGRHEAWDARTDHWPRLRIPVLLLSGESDPFARIDLLRAAVANRLDGTDAELVTYPALGHGLAPVLDDVAARIVEFVGRVAEAGTRGGP
jgi:predicted alpha/beta-hydrolase family hydrolase